MAHKLKTGMESFTVVDGPFAGLTFAPGMAYGEIPPQEAHRFEEIKEAAPEPLPEAVENKQAKADKQKVVDDLPSEKSEVK
jgi:hypothetical protein